MDSNLRVYIYNNEEIFEYFLHKNNIFDENMWLYENIMTYLNKQKKSISAENIIDMYDNIFTNEIYDIMNKDIPKDNHRGQINLDKSNGQEIYGLFLDDIRTPINSNHLGEHINWDIVRNYEEFMDIILSNESLKYKYISLDHDLTVNAMRNYFVTNGDINYKHGDKTGYDVAKMIKKYILHFPSLSEIFIHSNNKKGRYNIFDVLEHLNINIERKEWEYSDSYKTNPNYLEYLKIKEQYKKG